MEGEDDEEEEEEKGSFSELIETEQVVEVMEGAQFVELATSPESDPAVGAGEARAIDGEGKNFPMEEEKAKQRRRRKRSLQLEAGFGTGKAAKRVEVGVTMSQERLLRAVGREVCALSSEGELQLVAAYLGIYRLPLCSLSPAAVALEHTYFGGRVKSQRLTSSGREIVLQDKDEVVLQGEKGEAERFAPQDRVGVVLHDKGSDGESIILHDEEGVVLQDEVGIEHHEEGVVLQGKERAVLQDMEGTVLQDEEGVVLQDKEGVVLQDKEGGVLQDEGGRVEVVGELALCLPPPELLGEGSLYIHGGKMEEGERGGEGGRTVVVERGAQLWIVHR